MKKLILTFSLFYCLMSVHASHFMGGEISTRYIGDSTGVYGQFEISAKLFGDTTSTVSLPSTFGVSVKSSVSAAQSITLNLVSSQAIAISCSDGVQIARYKNSYTIPVYGAPYTFSFNGALRTNNIDNFDVINNSVSLYLSTTIHAVLLGIDSTNSPEFIFPPQFLIPANQVSTLDFSATAKDADSLWYELVDAQHAASSSSTPVSVPYYSNYSGAAPFDSSTTTILNNHTGILSVTNPNIGNYVVVVEVQAYKNGALRSTTRRDVLVKVDGMVSQVPPPQTTADSLSVLAGSFTQTSNEYNIEIFENGTVSAKILGASNLTIAGNLVNLNLHATGNFLSTTANINKATFKGGTLNGPSSVSGYFNFQTDTNFVGYLDTVKSTSFTFLTNFLDSCGVFVYSHLVFNIKVKTATIQIDKNHQAMCIGSGVTARVYGDTTNLSWSPVTGVSNPFSASPFLSPSTNTIYTVTNLNDGSKQSVEVTVLPALQKPTLILNPSSIQISPNFVNFDKTWFYKGFEISANTLFSGIPNSLEGEYYARINDSLCSMNSDTALIDHLDQSSFGPWVNNTTLFHSEFNDYRFTLKAVKSTLIRRFYLAVPAINAITNYKIYIYKSDGTSAGYGNLGKTIGLGVFSFVFFQEYFIGAGDSLDIHIYAPLQTTLMPSVLNQMSGPVTDNSGNFQITNSYAIMGNGDTIKNAYPYFGIQLESGVGVDENDLLAAEIYPNPIQDKLHISVGESAVFQLIDITGKVLFTKPVEDESTLSTEHLPAGVYFYQLKSTEGNAQKNGKLIKL